jgi:hypothetical protein
MERKMGKILGKCKKFFLTSLNLPKQKGKKL